MTQTSLPLADLRVLGGLGVVEVEGVDVLEGLRAALLAHGVWVRGVGRVVYLTPALNIPEADLMMLARAVRTVVFSAG